MLHKIATYIAQNQLFQAQDKILIATSGGRDSVTLLDILTRLSYQVAIAHCNFQLRGEESVLDEQFTRALAKQYQVPCFVTRFETSQYAEKNNVSIQIAARTLRYDWFADLLEKEGYAVLATAHHLNDNIETILHRLARGTGITGLQGIPAQNKRVVRPLLCVSQTAIAEYAQENGLTWREDSSNAQDKYTRNLIRHAVVPVLKRINPNLEQTFAHTLERLQGYALHFQESVEALRRKISTGTPQATYFALAPLLLLSAGKVFLAELLQPYHFNYQQVQLIWTKIQEKAIGVLFLSPSHSLSIDREAIVITPQNSLPTTGFFDIQLAQTVVETPAFSLHLDWQASATLPTNTANILLDLATLTLPMTIRRWKAGDFFRPLGMQGSKKKISDFLNDQKIPRNLKPDVWVLCTGDEIVWVIGFRMAHPYRLTEKTTKVLHIQLTASPTMT